MFVHSGDRLSQRSLLNCFLTGLTNDIQRELCILKITNLHDAVGMMKLIEDKFSATKLITTRPFFPRSATLEATPAMHHSVSLPIKPLTPGKMWLSLRKASVLIMIRSLSPITNVTPHYFSA